MIETGEPDWSIKIYPQTAIEGRKISGFAVADILSDLVEGKPSSWGGILVRGADGNDWEDWGTLGDDLVLENVGSANFYDDGTAVFGNSTTGGAGGFFALPARTPLAAGGAGFGSVGDNASEYAAQVLSWVQQSGVFEAVRPVSSNATSAIRNTGNPLEIGRVNTGDVWPRGRGIHLDLTFHATGKGIDQAYIRIRVSENLWLALHQNQPPMLLRRTVPKSGNAGTAGRTVWKTMTGAGEFDARKRHYSISLFTMGGRLVWEVNGHSRWYVESAAEQTSLPSGVEPPAIERIANMDNLLGGIPLQVEMRNLRARVEVARRDHTTEDGEPLPGKIIRKIIRIAGASGILSPSGVGHLPPGTNFPATVEESSDTLTYTVKLEPNEGGMFTPYITKVFLSYSPTWANPTNIPSGAGVEIEPVIKRATVSHAHPPVQSGSGGSLTLDLALAQELMPSVYALMQDYCPITIEGSWRDAGGTPLGPPALLLKGFVNGKDGTQRTPADATVDLTLHGMMMRLREPYAVIKDAQPLDVSYKERLDALDSAAQQAAEDNFVKVRDGKGNIIGAQYGGDRGYYGCQAAQDIVKQFLGDEVASTFNGNGNAKRYISSDRPPLIHFDDMIASWLAVATSVNHQLTTASYRNQTSSKLEPPWESDGYAWIESLAKDEYCQFAELFADRDASGFPLAFQVLAYGERARMLDAARFFYISASDIEYISRDDAGLMEEAGYETRPDLDYNEIVVWNTMGKTVPGAPAMIQGSARFHPNHPRSAEKTGLRTKILRTPLARTPAQAKTVAGIALLESDGSKTLFPKFKLTHGQANVMPGDVFRTEDSGDLGYDGDTFRASSIGHEFDKSNGRTWQTHGNLDIMTAREIAIAKKRAAWPF